MRMLDKTTALTNDMLRLLGHNRPPIEEAAE